MGEVYRADDLRLRQPVALKLLPADLASDAARLARFHGEVRLARQVSHPNVCRVHDLGEAEGLTFLTMELVDGEDLSSLLRRVGRLPAERAVEVARQICAGLSAVHEAGLLHRDLKPANVMIDGRGRARLADFGLAVAADSAQASREIAGTPAYMAPEQRTGGALSARTDVFALGLVLYELFTGRRAFETEAGLDVARAAPLTRFVPELDPRLERTILQCLAGDPASRPASAALVAASLAGPDALARAIAAGETPSPEMVAAAGEGRALSPALAVALAAYVVAAMAVAVVFHDRLVLFNQLPLDKPPAALVARARELLRRLGHPGEPADETWGFAYERRYLRWVEEHDASADRWRRFSGPGPPAVSFWYRASPVPLSALHPANIVTARDPPLEPGMALVRFDTRGRLVELQAPPGSAATAATAADPRVLLAEAGLDGTPLRQARAWVPPFFADTTVSFEGSWPGDPTRPLRVDAAFLGGRPVAFRVGGPWDDLGAAAGRPMGAGGFAGGMLAVTVPVLLAGLLLAWRNHRRGRSDRRAAFRASAFSCGAWMVYAALRYGHGVSALAQWEIISHATARALFVGAETWVLYMALEPYVRRLWPETLIGWSRLVTGRWRDSAVGRDVLAGTAASISAFLLVTLANELARQGGRPAPRLMELDLGLLLGTSRFVAKLAWAASTCLVYAVMALLLLVLLRALLRRRDAAVAAFGLVQTAVFVSGWRAAAPGPGEILVLLALGALITLAAARFGLLALMLMMLLGVLEAPVTTRLSTWYAAPAFLAYGLVALLVAWGLAASLAGRTLRLLEWLED
jgi:serine/threonine-protein kinase